RTSGTQNGDPSWWDEPPLCRAVLPGWARWRSAEQGEDALRELVGLGQHGGAGLLEDVGAGVADHLVGHVGVADPRLRGGEVLDRDLQVVDRVVEAVLLRTQIRTHRRHRLDGLVDELDRLLRTGAAGVVTRREGRPGGV